MKLTEHQISTIYRFTDPSCIDQSKLISYLELHKTVKNKVFNYCSKIKDKNLDSHGYCSFLDKEPMYTPVDRETFIRRIPFYFYQILSGDDRSSGLTRIIPLSHSRAKTQKDYEAFYADLEWMYYDLGISIEAIFNYIHDQLTSDSQPRSETSNKHFPEKFPNSISQTSALQSHHLFSLWRHYLHLCSDNNWVNFMPERFISSYNEALIRVGQKPIIYHPIKMFDTVFEKAGKEIICYGHFPCDNNGNPILSWTSIKVKNPAAIFYNGEKSCCGELHVKISPTTIVYILDDKSTNSEDPVWHQVYAGPQTMMFDCDALWEFRKAKGLTQDSVADAIGTNVRTYQKWESGESTPDGYFLLRLMNWLDIEDVQSLIRYIDPTEGKK